MIDGLTWKPGDLVFISNNTAFYCEIPDGSYPKSKFETIKQGSLAIVIQRSDYFVAMFVLSSDEQMGWTRCGSVDPVDS